jgi:hypothetical protein
MVYGWHSAALEVPGSPFVTTAAADVLITLDGSGDKIASVFISETASAITHVGYRQGAATGTPPTYRLSIQGVDSSGNPDGTIKGGGSPASGTFTPTAGEDGEWVWIALTNSYTPALGELLSIVLDYSSGTVDGSNFITAVRSSTGIQGQGGFPYSLADTTGSWTKASGGFWGYKTASARYGHYCQATSMETITTSGHRRALAFTFAGEGASDYKLLGGNFFLDFPASGNVKFGLWSAGGLLASVTLGSSQVASSTVDRVCHIYFDTQPTLTPGTKYYLGVEADGNAFEVGNFAFAEADDIAAWTQSTELALATFDGSSWTETATQTPMFQPVIQSVTGRGVPLRQIIGVA